MGDMDVKRRREVVEINKEKTQKKGQEGEEVDLLTRRA
jgi:hypothetical protein